MTDETGQTEPALATELTARFELGEAAAALLAPNHTPAEFFSVLGRAGLYRDAFNFAAHYLPKRRAIWWGCLCAWELFRDGAPPAEEPLIRAVVDWIREPTDAHRRAALQAAREGKSGTIGGTLAMAVFSAEGSLSPENCPPVGPPDSQAATFVAAAVILAGQMAPRRHRRQFQRHFLELAVDLSHGNALCEDLEPSKQTTETTTRLPNARLV